MGLLLVAAATAPPPSAPTPDGRQGPYEGTLIIDDAGHWLRADAAAIFFRAADRLNAEGIALTVNNATRTYEEQVALFAKYGYPRAAYPGTSEHEWRDGAGGEAVDVNPPYYNSGPAGARKHEVLTEEGFRRLSKPSIDEAWHYSLSGN